MLRERMTILFLFITLPFLVIAAFATLQVAAQEVGRGPASRSPTANAAEDTLPVASPLTATVQYTITHLGTLGGRSSFARSINDLGQVVGNAVNGNGQYRAFLWEDGTMSDLGALSATTSSDAFDINDTGQIAGTSVNADHKGAAVMWQGGSIIPLQHSGLRSYATAINDAGTVVGVADVGEENILDHAVLWQGGTRIDLGTLGESHSWAQDINDAGQVVGAYYEVGTVSRGFLWENGSMTNVGVDFGGGYTHVFGINDAGDIAGVSATGTGQLHAFVKRSDGTIIDLGTLGGHTSWAYAINNATQVIGFALDGANQSRAFLWQNDTMTDLNDLVDPDSGWVLQRATDINDAGQIVGFGTLDGEQRAFLLTPMEKAWTVMFYLDGDNNLDDTYPPIMNQLEAAADNPNVNVVVLWDRSSGPAHYYHVQHDTDLNELADYEEGETMWSQGEVNMGFPTTLSEFATWAMEEFPARHYALVLDDHGNGLSGGLVDDTSGRSMNLPEMKLALATTHEQTNEKIDVLFMAMCLMGMIEDAYQFRAYTDYYVANENIQWSYEAPYDDYVSGITETSTPAQVAQGFASAYADVAEAEGDAYTISVVDMSQLETLTSATYGLGFELDFLMYEISPTVTAVLSDVQRFDNEPPHDSITPADTSIDLYHFADLISLELLEYGDIVIAATEVMSALDNAVIYERHASSSSTNLDNSHGLAVFFPSTSSSFYHPDNYDFAVGAGWAAGGGTVRAPEGEGSWAGMLTSYVEAVNPDGPDNPEPPEPVAKSRPGSEAPPGLFIPMITR